MKRDSFVIWNSKTVIHLSQVAQFVCAPHVYHKMPGIKKVKYSTKTASSDSIPEDLHNDPIYIVRKPNKIYDSFIEKMEILPRNQVIWII